MDIVRIRAIFEMNLSNMQKIRQPKPTKSLFHCGEFYTHHEKYRLKKTWQTGRYKIGNFIVKELEINRKRVEKKVVRAKITTSINYIKKIVDSDIDQKTILDITTEMQQAYEKVKIGLLQDVDGHLKRARSILYVHAHRIQLAKRLLYPSKDVGTLETLPMDVRRIIFHKIQGHP
jgi:hypothetical protein